MNTDNTNLENSIGSESLGVVNQTPINNEPINNMGEETFNPFQDLNSAPLNVPTDGVNVQAQPEFQTEPSFDNQVPAAAPETLSEPTVNSFETAPASNADVFNAAPIAEPTPVEAPASFTTNQAAPTIDISFIFPFFKIVLLYHELWELQLKIRTYDVRKT